MPAFDTESASSVDPPLDAPFITVAVLPSEETLSQAMSPTLVMLASPKELAPNVSGVMFPVPSNDTPPMVLADARAVAVAANPTAIFAVPSNEVPPIVLAVSSAVAVAALPVVDPELPDVFPVTLPVMFPANVDVRTPVVAL